jgi:hypothetical protein
MAGQSTERHLTVKQSGTTYHPIFGDVVRYRFEDLSDNPDIQVQQTVDRMRDYIASDTGAPSIRSDARRALAEGGGDKLAGVWGWVRRHMEFMQDRDIARMAGLGNVEDVVEVIVRPVDASEMIRRGRIHREDCDGFETYGACLLRALDVPVCFCTISADAEDPSLYSHIYLVAYPGGGRRVPMDFSHGPYLGWEAPNLGRKREWPVEEICEGNPGWGMLTLVVLGIAYWAVDRRAMA